MFGLFFIDLYAYQPLKIFNQVVLRKVQKFSSVQKDSSIDEIPIKVKSRVGGWEEGEGHEY